MMRIIIFLDNSFLNLGALQPTQDSVDKLILKILKKKLLRISSSSYQLDSARQCIGADSVSKKRFIRSYHTTYTSFTLSRHKRIFLFFVEHNIHNNRRRST